MLHDRSSSQWWALGCTSGRTVVRPTAVSELTWVWWCLKDPGSGSSTKPGKWVTWCLMPSQPAWLYQGNKTRWTVRQGAGIAQWLEHRTRDWKVAGSNPCWNGGRIFFSRVNFLCWLLFRYLFHPCVTTVARKKSRSFCQKCRWQVTAKHAYTLRMWILLNRASALVTTCP